MQTGLIAVNNWSFTQKLFFRFFAAYFFIFIFPFPFGFIPYTDAVTNLYSKLWDAVIPWTGKYILHISYPVSIQQSGSGDKTYDYVQVFLFAMVGLIAAIVWSVADRKRKSYDKLLYWVMVYVRYYLAFTMMSYGFYKIIKTQFPFPFYNLTETYSESSPMGLLWNFMGYSTAYNTFTGIAEALGGFLLLFRKTTTFGALLSVTVLANIVALNFCFDVPVKLYSSNLLFMAIFIVLPDTWRLINFFFRNKAVPAVNIQPKFNKRWMKITWVCAKFLLIILAVYSIINQVWSGYTSYGDKAVQKNPFFGIYNVETFVRNNDTLQPVITDTTRWKTLNISFAQYVVVKMMNDSTKGFSFTSDTLKRTIKLDSYNDTTYKSTFAYYRPDKEHLIFSGRIKNDSVYIKMKKIDMQKMRLISRGFHWINEYPYNR